MTFITWADKFHASWAWFFYNLEAWFIVNLHIEILHECSCFIEFIKQVEEEIKYKVTKHFISFSQQV